MLNDWFSEFFKLKVFISDVLRETLVVGVIILARFQAWKQAWDWTRGPEDAQSMVPTSKPVW